MNHSLAITMRLFRTRTWLVLLGVFTLTPLGRPAAGQSDTRIIQGVTKDSASGETLPYAILGVEGTNVTARADRDGHFTLIGVPVGRQVLTARYIGYTPVRLTIDVSVVGSVFLTVRMVASAVRLSEVAVREARIQSIEAGQSVGETTVSAAQVAITPTAGEKDVFRTLQLLPGVSNANKGTSGLYVRGGTPDQNLVLFDGMTMYHVDHFFGIFSAFNPDAVKDVRLYAGGYPAKFGGRVSSVVDLTGKTGNEETVRGSAGLSLLSGRALVEVPLGRGALLLSGRRSYTDIIQSGLYNKLFATTGSSTTTQPAAPQGRGFGGRGGFTAQTIEPKFYFHDENAKLSYRPTSRDLVSISGYSGGDVLDQSNSGAVNFRGGPGGFGGLPDGSTAGQLSNTNVSNWGNHGGSGRWLRQWNGRLSTDALIASSRYYSNADRSTQATLTSTTGSAGTLAQPAFKERNTVDDVTLRIDNEVDVASSLTFDFGTWLTRNQVNYQYTQTRGDSALGGLLRDATGTMSSAYAQANWSPIRRVMLTGGVRSTAYDLRASTYVEPRLQGSLQLTDALKLKAAWGRYHQFVTRVENEDVLSGSHDFWLLSDSSLAPTAAEHRIAGISWDGGNYLLSIEAYDKDLDNVTLFSKRFRRQSFIADYNTLFYTGTGRARGVDVLAQRKFGAFTGWLSYSLSEATERYAEINDGEEFPSLQDQRHQFKSVGTYQPGRWTFSSAFIYGTGSPYTTPESQYYLTLLDGSRVGFVHVGDKNSARLPSYHRLDLAAFRRFEINRRLDWELGVSVFNLYDRQNVAYRRFDLTTAPITVTDVHTLGRTPSLDLRIILK